MRSRLATLVVSVLCGWSCTKNEPVNIEATHPKFSAGQVWSYRTRPGEEKSRLTVLRIDKKEPQGFIVHIRLDDVSMKNPSAPNGIARTIGHLPFALASIDASVITLERTGAVPDFGDGYRMWRDAFDQNKAGVWTTSVADAVNAMETGLSKNQ